MVGKLGAKAIKRGLVGELGFGSTRLRTKVTQVDSNSVIDRSECQGQGGTLGT